MKTTTLTESQWMASAADHLHRAESRTRPALRRRAAGVPHPVEDFLFTYYRFSFRKLEAWHPRFGVRLESPDAPPPRFRAAPYRQIDGQLYSDPESLSPKSRARILWIRELLDQTRRRTSHFACHGIHEWAMVYRGSDIRHKSSTPLRLSQKEIDETVESRPIACSHFDAVRFFHPDAQNLNRLRPGLETRPDFEQPGCVHANMDLYKWAAKSMPWVGSELLMDCFELALELRELDMRASPYDLSAFKLEPVRIETSSGRSEYETLQRQLAGKAEPLRHELIGILDEVLSALAIAPGSCHTGSG